MLAANPGGVRDSLYPDIHGPFVVPPRFVFLVSASCVPARLSTSSTCACVALLSLHFSLSHTFPTFARIKKLVLTRRILHGLAAEHQFFRVFADKLC